MIFHSSAITIEWSLSGDGTEAIIRQVPVDCYGEYGNWTTCSANCGGGTRQRVYSVLTPVSSGGLTSTCAAADGEVATEACNESPCPIDCQGGWGDWSTCSSGGGSISTCGGGLQSRQYAVATAAAHGGSSDTCAAEDGSSQIQSCNSHPCPVDCAGEWSEWDSCNATCAGGLRSRYFNVTQQPMYGGSSSSCDTADGTIQHVECNTAPCPVQCEGAWSGWGPCSESCGGGNRTRQFSVVTPAAHGGDQCPAVDGATETLDCNTHACLVPVDCAGNWGPWSDCSAACAGGDRSKTYQVVTAAADGGSNETCAAADGEEQSETCNSEPCPVDCQGSWGAWGSCSAVCGTGTRSRLYTVAVHAVHGGSAETCDESDGGTAAEDCNTQPCPVDCVGGWDAWSDCSAACGGGTRTKRYTVTTPAAHGGEGCLVEDGAEDAADCNQHQCPVDCEGVWSSWDSCNSTCGGGFRRRTYSVATPAAYGGTSGTCAAAEGGVDLEVCNTAPCPVQCEGAWSGWGPCSESCGGGNRTRQ
eukprot:SAG22_NODE_75_length_22256_cov_45.062960_1_plen_528_part_10